MLFTSKTPVSWKKDKVIIKIKSYVSSIIGHQRRLAREQTGLTAKHLINDYRVQQLKLALSTTTMSLKEVTHAFNFSDQSALTRYFKAHTGQSPKDYRK